MNLEQVGRNWVAGWNSRDSEAFSRLFTPDGEYVDPSFGIRRTGRSFLRIHHEIWWKAVPDFVMTARHIHVAARSVVVEVTAEGTFSGGDLGGGKMKATKKAFCGWSIGVLEVNEAGEIMICREYYDRSIVPGGAQPPFDELRPYNRCLPRRIDASSTAPIVAANRFGFPSAVTRCAEELSMASMPITHCQISVVIDGRNIVEAYTKRRWPPDFVIRHRQGQLRLCRLGAVGTL